MTPLPLTPEQVRTLQETGNVETREPLPDPGANLGYMIGARFQYAVRCGEDYPDDASDRVPVPHPIGAQAWVQEEWIKCTGCYEPPGLVYKAGCTHVPAHKWKKAKDMPQWASRFNIVSTAVRVERREGVWGFVTTWRKA